MVCIVPTVPEMSILPELTMVPIMLVVSMMPKVLMVCMVPTMPTDVAPILFMVPVASTLLKKLMMPNVVFWDKTST